MFAARVKRLAFLSNIGNLTSVFVRRAAKLHLTPWAKTETEIGTDGAVQGHGIAAATAPGNADARDQIHAGVAEPKAAAPVGSCVEKSHHFTGTCQHLALSTSLRCSTKRCKRPDRSRPRYWHRLSLQIISHPNRLWAVRSLDRHDDCTSATFRLDALNRR